MTKLKIDLRSGVLEIEGAESLVREIYQDYKEKIVRGEFEPVEELSPPSDAGTHTPSTKPRRTKSGASKTTNKRKESYQIVKDLDLSPKGGKESLKDFYSKKSPSTALKRNALFVYYLQKIAKTKDIGVNHIYACYKNVSERVPGALRQSLLDTSSRNGWIDTKSMQNITITTHGENLVEHELTVQKKG